MYHFLKLGVTNDVTVGTVIVETTCWYFCYVTDFRYLSIYKVKICPFPIA